jgi:hypothetical protein
VTRAAFQAQASLNKQATDPTSHILVRITYTSSSPAVSPANSDGRPSALFSIIEKGRAIPVVSENILPLIATGTNGMNVKSKDLTPSTPFHGDAVAAILAASRSIEGTKNREGDANSNLKWGSDTLPGRKWQAIHCRAIVCAPFNVASHWLG